MYVYIYILYIFIHIYNIYIIDLMEMVVKIATIFDAWKRSDFVAGQVGGDRLPQRKHRRHRHGLVVWWPGHTLWELPAGRDDAMTLGGDGDAGDLVKFGKMGKMVGDSLEISIWNGDTLW